MKRLPILYYIGRTITYIVAKTVFGYKVINREFVPEKGPFIIASNHISYYDPPLVGTATKRVCHFFAKRELFHNAFFGWILRHVNAIPVNRFGFDKNSLDSTLDILRHGGGVVLFPEGTRSRSGELMEMKPGVGMIAAKSGATIIPALVENARNATKNRLLGKKVIVRFADPICPEAIGKMPTGKDGYREIALEIARRIKSLKLQETKLEHAA